LDAVKSILSKVGA
jgi:hypothetical protein